TATSIAMRNTVLLISTALFVLTMAMTGCRNVSVGASTGNVSVGAGGGSVGAGVHTGSGQGVFLSSNYDFLYSGNGEAYSNNKRGLESLLAKDYFAAKEIFKGTLEKYPTNPDATYYLGLTLIYQNERDAGYSLLLQYRDPFKIRITQEVKWWAAYCQKKPELTAEKVHQVMNKARSEGYQRDQEEEWERRRW
ncbi:hypothetical protein OAN24_06320, partial [Pseudodesulfovibrio sp.]|nr:hypothetical protein [Pseudodesulfovibrio sp.]